MGNVDVLLVEDSQDLAQLLSMFIEREGFAVKCVNCGEDAVRLLESEKFGVIILDVTLPNMDGFAVLGHIRQKDNTPILILSAKVEKEDKINGFTLGADDYIEKPVDPDILIAKMRAVMARTYGAFRDEDIISSENIKIDVSSHRVYKNNELIDLNVKEFELLTLLMRNRGKSLSKDFLFDSIWGADSFSENQTLTVHIKRLRDKIEDNPKNPSHIKTVWGVGYRYE